MPLDAPTAAVTTTTTAPRPPRPAALPPTAPNCPRSPSNPPKQDLQSAALLCEAAYRTHFSAGELRGHLDGVRALLSEADVGDLEVHTAGDQR